MGLSFKYVFQLLIRRRKVPKPSLCRLGRNFASVLAGEVSKTVKNGLDQSFEDNKKWIYRKKDFGF